MIRKSKRSSGIFISNFEIRNSKLPPLGQVPRSAAYPDGLRYRLAFLPAGTKKPAVLFDNHRPKGHHRHRGDVQIAYTFSTIDQLLMDFLMDVQRAKAGRKEERK